MKKKESCAHCETKKPWYKERLYIVGLITIAALLLAGGVAGGHKLYESAGVRDMLIRLGRAKQKSNIEADLMIAVPALAAQVAQAAQSEQQEPVRPN